MARPIDWIEFHGLVQRHRIPGLAGAALCAADFAIPADVRSKLADEAQRYAARDLLHAAETARLQQIFDRAGVPAMFLKGSALGMLAYGRLGLKYSWDIDLLTTEPSALQALQLLEQHGYRLSGSGGLPRHALRRFTRFTHEIELRNDRGMTVELHWRLFSKPILSGVTGASETQTVDIGGATVRTLREDLLVAFLIAHGQEHGWSRLKWIADLNALLAQKTEDELAELHARAATFDLEAKTSAALLLCAQLFDLPLPEPLQAKLRRNRTVKRLVEADLACIAHPLSGQDLPVLSRASIALITSRFGRGTGWRMALAELGALWTQPTKRARYPAALDFLYHLLRVPIWLLRVPLRLAENRRVKVRVEREC
ncbi:nucleotidyltransferase family protein [Sphingomonas psychrotolerans]|uniref:Nucleotidyltransferase family protein n=1 Tax=Sphingomonas psychrotolerans TaxID=1327635 RepID=A0ABU3N8R4_9SPHN|nr:nucleotidyltransferase family protein [Sphingomonas psychrotolerans]MDT8759755.1 nucleotidyltransferase family protein [Sphingomonas psychrotolerans]